MSYRVSPSSDHSSERFQNGDSSSRDKEWVEIVEPRSKTKIYADLVTGICAKHPPNGVTIIKADDFTDHWWELYDKKTGKYYYYNPELQKTAWTKPTPNNNGDSHRLLIIPVSKLQTFRKLSPIEQNKEKCDASTQTTIDSNLVSTGTQTASEPLEDELNNKLRYIDLNSDSAKSSSCTHTNKSPINRRQLSDFTGRHRVPHLKSYHNQSSKEQHATCDQIDCHQSSQFRPVSNHHFASVDDDYQKDASHFIYFGPLSSYHKNRISTHVQGLANNQLGQLRNDEHTSSTSTFRSPPRAFASNVKQDHDSNNNNSQQQPQRMTTNNLSHYLVREARAMGIALISDDEMDDEDQDSDDDCVVDDEDEDTDLRDDSSSHRGRGSDLNASQDFGEDSSEGWKSFSDPESPNGSGRPGASCQAIQKSPILCETSASFTYNELIDDQKDPASCMSQQLDHRKLVENFKKSRQTSGFGFNDSLGRSCKLDANQAVQKIKNVADSYFTNDREQLTDKHLRHLSTLSTLPRPSKESKDKTSTPKLMPPIDLDADYDVVEENCSYYSDSEHAQTAQTLSTDAKKPSITKTHTEPQSPFDRNKSTRGSTFSVESFARENLTRHPKGGLLFNRKVKWSRMISWKKGSIRQPMISSVSSDLNADSIASFKLIQQFMGDRKVTITKKYRQILAQSGISEDSYGSRKSLGRTGSINIGHNTSISSSSSVPSIPDRLRDELAFELAVKGCTKTALRDEIFVQLARQLTENPSQGSIDWGLILMSILLNYFSPSAKFAPFLFSFLEMHSHPMARDVCLPRLEKRRQNCFSYCRKPADGKEISIVRLSITKWPQYCGVFGESLERIMSLQACSPYLRTLRLPWILTTLGDKLIETGGAETEGIFRCAADHDLLAQLRLEIDCVDFRKITDAKQVKSLLSNVQDPHVIAGLLKLFFRQLHEPVFPARIYEACLQNCQDGQMACRLFNEHLPNLNKDVVAYLIRMLQLLSEGDKVAHTKMDNSNLSMVWAPNLLRVPEKTDLLGNDSKNGSKWSITNGSADDTHQPAALATPSQSIIFEQTRQEMQFIRSLIIHLDTSFIKDVI